MNPRSMASSQRVPGSRPGRAPDSDEVLLATFAGGDSDAFETLFFRHRDRLAFLGHGLTGRSSTGEELARRAMVRVFRARRPPAAGLPLRLALLRELVRRTRRFDRRRRALRLVGRQPRLRTHRILPLHRLASSGRDRNHERRRLVVRALASLPRNLREAVALCDLECLSYEEASAVLRVRARTVGLRLGRGRLHFSAAFQRLARR